MRNSQKDKNKILIVCQDFVPYFHSLGGVLRVITLSEYLINNGYEVFILTSKGNYYGYFGYLELCKKMQIFYMNDSQKQRNISTNVNKNDINKSLIDKSIYFLKRLISDFIIPDKGIRFIPRYYFMALRIVRNYDIRNVLISSPPHSTQVLGLLMKMKLGNNLNLIVDYRDSWNTSSIFSKKLFINKFISSKLEKSILKKTDRFLYVSEPILIKIEKLHNIRISNKSVLVMNGFSTKIDTNSLGISENKKIQIGYFGSVSDDKSSFRNIYSLLFCLKRCKELNNKIDFHFYGPITLKNYNINDFKNIFIHKTIEHEQALMKMAEKDYLLIIHSDITNSDEVITGKFFEYISVQKPIICLAPKNMEAVRLVEKYDIGIHIDVTNSQEIIDKLLVLKKQMNNSYKQMDINDFSRDKQYAKILKYLI